MTAVFGKLIKFTCDGAPAGRTCPHVFDSQRFRIVDAATALTNAGWIIRRRGDHWVHYCGQCTCWLDPNLIISRMETIDGPQRRD
jgi:hypothetical protein